MQVTNKYKRVPCSDIVVKREERQRRVVNTAGLKDSIAKIGVLNPIIITKDFILVAGERRLASSIELGLHDIPCRFIEELSPIEAQIVELEENIRRSDLAWQDEVKSIAKLHNMYASIEPEWNVKRTAEELNFDYTHLLRFLRVSKEMDNPKVSTASSMFAAFNMLSREDERKMGDAVSDIIDAGSKVFEKYTGPIPGGSSPRGSADEPKIERPAQDLILNTSFLEWAPKYEGRPFNFIHCDFPYGINVFAGAMSGVNTTTAYDDSADVYWALISCLCQNLDRLMSHSAHLMFWFSMEHYIPTLKAFAKQAPDLNFQLFPLIWHKTDNVGIIPDPKRGPRRIYETALIASREDRYIVKPMANTYGAPTSKLYHPSTKPEPVLNHFMTMFVDEHTRMLDPTCGSASSLRSAIKLGAESVLGLEIDPEHYKNAQSAMRKFHILRATEK